MSSLSLVPRAGLARCMDNLLPQPTGFASRPGAAQVIAGSVEQCWSFGGSLVFVRAGHLWRWDGFGEADLGAVPAALAATGFDALTANARRESRLYLGALGVPLFYLDDAGRHPATNSVLDAAGVPYPVPRAGVLTTFRGRVWTADGNRLHHCEFDASGAWDPLYTVELQTGRPDAIRAALPVGEALVVALGRSIWSITGDSQYNWQRSLLLDGRGVVGPQALTSDGARAFYLSAAGLYQLGESDPVTDTLDELWRVPDPLASLLLDPSGRWLLVLVHGRLLAWDTRQQRCGEIIAPQARGVIAHATRLGWYGRDGVWLLGDEDAPDVQADGRSLPVASRYEGWDEAPNPLGRAVLARSTLAVMASTTAQVSYAVQIDGVDSPVQTRTIGRSTGLHTWRGDLPDTAPVSQTIEFPVHRAGTQFRHRLTGVGPLDVRGLASRYQFGPEPKEDV